jgi:transposase
LQGWKGHLVVDDYADYKALFAAGVIEVGCMAHARRKFFELHKANQGPVAGDALQRIAELYEIESRGRELANSERECEASLKLQAMQDWLQGARDTVADGGGLARAIDYSLKRWPALSLYARSAILPIDNNPVENIIRPISGRSPWEKRTGYSLAPNAPGVAPPRFKSCWPPPNSTTSNLPLGSKTRWKNSPSGRIAGLMNYCRWA